MAPNRHILFAAIISSGFVATSVYAQGQPKMLAISDPTSLAAGDRTSRVVGAAVVNAANETIGSIDDLIVTPSGQGPYAVLSVGGFLGMGIKYVVVPYSSLWVRDKKMVLPGRRRRP